MCNDISNTYINLTLQYCDLVYPLHTHMGENGDIYRMDITVFIQIEAVPRIVAALK